MFGALTCVNRLYFTFITRLKNVFVQCLSYEHLVIYGSFLVERIKNALLNDKIVLSEFVLFIHEDVSHNIKTIVVFAVNSLFTNAWKRFLYETTSKIFDIEDDYKSNNGNFG